NFFRQPQHTSEMLSIIGITRYYPYIIGDKNEGQRSRTNPDAESQTSSKSSVTQKKSSSRSFTLCFKVEDDMKNHLIEAS
ncbi:hypothetical protein PMAYCL1PPCAC_32198, partial [Pristionchus mayeri]